MSFFLQSKCASAVKHTTFSQNPCHFIDKFIIFIKMFDCKPTRIYNCVKRLIFCKCPWHFT